MRQCPNSVTGSILPFARFRWLPMYIFIYYCRFLRNPNSNEYKAYRELVNKMRGEVQDRKPEVKPEDKYEPEFSLEDDDSNDNRPIKDEYKYR